jgi:3'-phosphoadenosine 5'-phosphosulfate sulfotransferase (PAPS reductase)/FAD synthetase
MTESVANQTLASAGSTGSVSAGAAASGDAPGLLGLARDRDITNKTWHIVALSGGKDSTALALRLAEVEPRNDYLYVCTPTGDELPEMWEWWKQLGCILGKQIKPVMETTLKETIERNKCLPNFRIRFCTRQIKIEPYRRFLTRLRASGTVVSYVGLRADEEGRAGGAYNDIEGITLRFPLREWGWGLPQVQGYLMERGIVGARAN